MKDNGAGAPFGPWGDSAVIIKYGDSGLGKTTDDVYSFPQALFIPIHPDGVKVARGVVGWPLEDHQVRPAYDLDQAVQILLQVAKDEPTRYPAVVLDDLSLMMANQHRVMMASGRYSVKGGYDWEIWTDLRSKLDDLGTVARYHCQMHVVCNAHVRMPEVKKGDFYKGGPWMPSTKMVKFLPHIASSVLQCTIEPTRLGPWKGAYRAELDPSWYMKERHGLSGVIPMNLGEMLRVVGYPLPRPPALAWMEEWVEVIARRLDEGKGARDLVDKAKKAMLERNRPPLHIRWVIRDGLDRHAIRKLKTNNALNWAV